MPVNHSSTLVSVLTPTRSLALPAKAASSSVLEVADDQRVSEFKHVYRCHVLEWRTADIGVKCIQNIMNQCHQIGSYIIEPFHHIFLTCRVIKYFHIT
jgi:hypothetical protein